MMIKIEGQANSGGTYKDTNPEVCKADSPNACNWHTVIYIGNDVNVLPWNTYEEAKAYQKINGGMITWDYKHA